MKRMNPLDAGSGSAESMPVVPDSSAEAARKDDSQSAGYWVSEYRHRVYRRPGPARWPVPRVRPQRHLISGRPPVELPALELSVTSNAQISLNAVKFAPMDEAELLILEREFVQNSEESAFISQRVKLTNCLNALVS
ncbi:MAG: hypothetical protein ACRDS9_13610 [Pseudonocardiaceae bacterium]